MIVRIRLKRGRPVQRKIGKNRHVAFAVGALLIPVALMAYVLAFWRLASDIGLAGEFGITGLFSHWQIWIGVGAILHLAASSFNRYGRGGDLNVPQILSFRMLQLRPSKQPLAPRGHNARLGHDTGPHRF
jgi:hypothetical protein